MKIYMNYGRRFLGVLSGTTIQALVNFSFFTGLSLILSPVHFGDFAFAYTIIFFIIPFLDFGATTYLLSKNNTVEEVNNYLNFIILISFLFLSFFLFYNISYFFVTLASITFLLIQYFHSYMIKFKQVKMQMKFAFIYGLFKVLAFILIFYFSNDKESIDFIILIIAISNILSLLPFIKRVKYHWSIKIGFFNKYFKSVSWIGFSGILAIILMRFDQIIMGKFLDIEYLGFYLISIQWLTIISLISNSLLKFSFSELENVSLKKYLTYLKNKTKIINLTLVVFFTTFLCISSIITFFLYENLIIIQSIIIISIGFLFSIKFNFYSIILYKTNNTKKLFSIQLYQFLIQVTFIYVSFPSLGYYSFPVAFSLIRIFGYVYIQRFCEKRAKLSY
ncbi:oligosaccharide flippase family protein [Bacillus haimaensis]|uniref:lipopolysaccharide biosynthesis protein n=1 Tax=Bacillus haimaensis TaxID=3160967 RepID=UPI003AA7CD62